MIKKLFSLFSSKTDVPSTKDYDKEIQDIVAFVDYVVRALVDEPGLVKVNVRTGDEKKGLIVNIVCKKADIGKIIGKNGKTIMAIRTLVGGAASRLNQQIAVEVADNIAD